MAIFIYQSGKPRIGRGNAHWQLQRELVHLYHANREKRKKIEREAGVVRKAPAITSVTAAVRAARQRALIKCWQLTAGQALEGSPRERSQSFVLFLFHSRRVRLWVLSYARAFHVEPRSCKSDPQLYVYTNRPTQFNATPLPTRTIDMRPIYQVVI